MIGIIEIICIFILLLLLPHSTSSPDNVTNDSNAPQLPKGLCLEKLGNSSYLYMVPHPDGSNRVFVCNQQGKIWLAMVPEVGSSQSLMIDESDPFLDLTDQVQFATEMGLTSIALHPNFTQNGRLFVVFNCDKFQQPGCEGRCSCNTDVGCDPSKVESLQESNPCQFHVVIAEFTANGTTFSSKLSWTGHANSVEVRRIFTMGLPFESYHAGQILFGPADNYLYFMIGDASHVADPYNFAQNKKSLIGKILRLDVDIIPSAEEISRLGLWGNYSIPKDNPYTTDTELEPEIWALGFSNPWRCSFDSKRPTRFICGDVGKDQYEEINLIKKGGNYGWRVYEGPYPTHPSYAPGGYTQPTSITAISPATGYKHDSVDASKGPASVVGGYFYHATVDPCLNGWYIYTDLYSFDIWAAIETTENSENLTSFSIPFGCARDSPMECGFKPGVHNVPDLGYVLSLSEDNNKDVYLLTSSGVYRVAAPSRCGYHCAKERSSCCDKINMKNGAWSQEGDEHMVAFVNKQTTSNWQIGAPRKPGLRRCGKSCRLKKTNVTRNDNIGLENFTPQEEELIIKLHSAIGSRWPIIAQQLPGRTENDVKNYWNTKLKKKLSSMGIDPVTHRPFSQMLADYGNISGLTRTQNRMGSLGSRDNKNTFFISNDQEIQQVPMETLIFPSFNSNVVKLEPPEVIKTDSLDLLTQLQAITNVKDSPTNQDAAFPFYVSVASSSSSSSSTCSTLNETNPQQTFNWREFLIENAHDGNVNDENLNLEVVGEVEVVKGNNNSNNTMLMNGVKETMEEVCERSFVETMLDGDHDMLLDFPGLMGEPSYY